MAAIRLQREFKMLMKEPVPYTLARPSANILKWHFVITGPPDSPYAGGQYHGVLTFNNEYPHKPPSIMMVTPSGRFEVNTRICLSMTDFHAESWNPLWGVGTILAGLLSFMLEDTSTTGSLSTSLETKRRLAYTSHEFNCRTKAFVEVFPDLVQDPIPTRETHLTRADSAGDDHRANETDEQRAVATTKQRTSHGHVPDKGLLIVCLVIFVSLLLASRWVGGSDVTSTP